MGGAEAWRRRREQRVQRRWRCSHRCEGDGRRVWRGEGVQVLEGRWKLWRGEGRGVAGAGG